MKIKNTKTKIGIMGGTFDPIHYGHLMLAEQVRTKFDLDYIYFVPSGVPPHKNDQNVEGKEHRYAMTLLATSTNPYFLVSDIEINKVEKTYTIDTINEILSQVHEATEVFFITGADAIITLETWKNYKELLGKCKFVAATRPGVDTRELEDKIEFFNEHYHSEIEMLMVPALSISSTDIRRRVSENLSIKYLLPETVETYILKNNLYKDSEMIKMENILRKRLSEKRFNHSVRVKHEAERLAYRYNENIEKAGIAGLLHDYSKEMRNESILAILAKEKIKVDEHILACPDIAHGIVGAVLVESDFDIHDEEILSSIKWHTTGYKEMCMLDKIIFIADKIEPGRNYVGVDRIREATYKNIDLGIYMFLRDNREYMKKKNKKVHHDSIELEKVLKDKLQKEISQNERRI